METQYSVAVNSARSASASGNRFPTGRIADGARLEYRQTALRSCTWGYAVPGAPLEPFPAAICPLDTARPAAVDEHHGGRLSTADPTGFGPKRTWGARPEARP